MQARRIKMAAVTLSVAFHSAQVFGAVELISNGSFSAGLASWTVTDLAGGSGSWFADTVGTTTPMSGQTTSAVNLAGAAAAGTYAVTDQSGPGTHAMEQSFVVPGTASSVILSFDMFVNDLDSGPIVNPAGLNHTVSPNQHARVDILTSGSLPFATGASVLANYYLGIDVGPDPHAFTHYSFNITSLVGAGGTFELRFAEVDNQLFLNMGIDNVSVMFDAQTTGVVPEPVSLFVWTALSGIGLCIARKKSQSAAAVALLALGRA